MRGTPHLRAVRQDPKEPEFLRTRVDSYFVDRVQNTWGGGHIMHGRTPATDDIRLVSNDYLCMADNLQVRMAMVNSLSREENNVLMSAVYLHGDNPQRDFERNMARYVGTEDALLCQSGYNANVGLLQSIVQPETPVYVDMFAHMSLWEGITSGGATPRPFRHNSASHLESQIEKHGPGVILVDAVYSTSGIVCPLEEMVAVAERNNCVIVVDESHSLGTHGPHGAGLVAELGLTSRVHFITASLAKAFAGRAGIVFCTARLSEYLQFTSNPAIFSSALVPHEIAGLSATLEQIRKADDLRERLRHNTSFLRCSLADLGYNVEEGEAQIIALEAGPEQQTMILRDALEARGVFGAVFCAPATPKNRSLIRFSVNAKLTSQELQKIVQVCKDIREEVGLADWASTRRKQRAGRAIAA